MPTLRELRQQAHLTQAELAEKSGLRQATLSALERGHSQPRSATIGALAGALGKEADEIRAALREAGADDDAATETDAIGQMARDWPFLRGLDTDLRTGLASALVAEWTHSSTALEGNTITLGDTLFVLTEGLTVSGKSLREHQELHGHGQALELMAAWTRAGRPMQIDHLHQLHRAVQTGSTIDSLAPIGGWKTEPNGTTAITTGGSSKWHDYAQPKHVPALIDQWLKQLSLHCRNPLFKTGSHSTTGKQQPAPAKLAAIKQAALDAYTDLHLSFAGIHPYADGNGRMARLLANVPVLRAGLPPLLIPSSERRTYLTLLGDYTLARGQPQPGEDLLLPGRKHSALHTFFASCWQSSFDLVEAFQRRQQAR